jgi:hypothetical protein
VIEALTTGQMVPSGTNNPPATCSQCFYHWIDTSAGGLLVPEGTICPVVSAWYRPSDRNTDYWADDTLGD